MNIFQNNTYMYFTQFMCVYIYIYIFGREWLAITILQSSKTYKK